MASKPDAIQLSLFDRFNSDDIWKLATETVLAQADAFRSGNVQDEIEEAMSAAMTLVAQRLAQQMAQALVIASTRGLDAALHYLHQEANRAATD
jgi:hypothetical protein